MTIPTHEEITLPILKFLADQKVHSVKEVLKHVIKHFKLSESERTRLISDGSRPIINNRIRWAKIILKKGGLIDFPSKGYFQITQKGIEILIKNPNGFKIKSKLPMPEPIQNQKPKKEKKKVNYETAVFDIMEISQAL